MSESFNDPGRQLKGNWYSYGRNWLSVVGVLAAAGAGVVAAGSLWWEAVETRANPLTSQGVVRV